ncbi:MAG TPA: hypothetical protein VD969_18870 [Symbiobacteriaceae bacterium]|nr:hypothetical protein [Symbiobacteriaceae bacterium]
MNALHTSRGPARRALAAGAAFLLVAAAAPAGALAAATPEPSPQAYRSVLGATAALSGGPTPAAAQVQIAALGLAAGAGVATSGRDVAAPVTEVSAPSTWQNGDVTVTLLAFDDRSGVLATYYALDGAAPQVGTNIRVAGEGVHLLEFWSVDLAGNAEAAKRETVRIDRTPPKIQGAPDRVPGPHGWYNGPVTLTFVCADDLSGIAECSGPAEVTAEGADQGAAGAASDHAGNMAEAVVKGINIDRTPPRIEGIPDRAPDRNGWYSGPVTVAFRCSDDISAIVACPGPTTLLAGAGGQAVSGTAVDQAGNEASADLAGINIDFTPPVTEAQAPFTWQNRDVTVTFAAADALSGVAATYFRLGDGTPQEGTVLTVDREGTAIVEFWSADQAGNAEPHRSVAVWIDKTPPAIEGAPDRAPNAAGWYSGDVTVTFTCTDDVSGITACTDQTVLNAEAGGQSASGTAADAAGNTAAVTLPEINIDKTGPQVAYDGSSAAYTVDQTIDIRCTAGDDLSGIATSTCADIVGPAYAFTPGRHQHSAAATDRAGNQGGASVSFTVDVTAESLCTLTTAFAGSGVQAEPLCAMLRAAEKAGNDSNTKAGQIQAFLEALAARTGRDSETLTPEQAETLAALVQYL